VDRGKKSTVIFKNQLRHIFFSETVVNSKLKSYPKVQLHTRKDAIIPECTTCAQILDMCSLPNRRDGGCLRAGEGSPSNSKRGH
jgi:hypothetical protein